MATGELDFDAIFRLDPSGGSDNTEEIKFPPISYILWIMFIVFIPVILMNMLVSCELLYIHVHAYKSYVYACAPILD